MKKLRVTVEGKVYNVLVEMLDEAGTPPPFASSPAPASTTAASIQSSVSAASTPAAAPAARTATAEAGPGDVKSPLAGRVVSVDVQAGQTVVEGAQVLTIEAMKMNTYIYAHKAGIVGAVLIAAGDGVEEGQTLLKIS